MGVCVGVWACACARATHQLPKACAMLTPAGWSRKPNHESQHVSVCTTQESKKYPCTLLDVSGFSALVIEARKA